MAYDHHEIFELVKLLIHYFMLHLLLPVILLHSQPA